MGEEAKLEFNKNLDEYLKKNGVKEIPTTNKEKLRLLRTIVYNSKVSIDLADLKQSSNRSKGISDPSYVDTIQNLEINVYNGCYYISNVRGIVREERKLSRIAKVKSLFGVK